MRLPVSGVDFPFCENLLISSWARSALLVAGANGPYKQRAAVVSSETECIAIKFPSGNLKRASGEPLIEMEYMEVKVDWVDTGQIS